MNMKDNGLWQSALRHDLHKKSMPRQVSPNIPLPWQSPKLNSCFTSIFFPILVDDNFIILVTEKK